MTASDVFNLSEHNKGRLYDLRQVYDDARRYLLDYSPPGREQSLALTNLEQSHLWAVAAVLKSAQI